MNAPECAALCIINTYVIAVLTDTNMLGLSFVAVLDSRYSC